MRNHCAGTKMFRNTLQVSNQAPESYIERSLTRIFPKCLLEVRAEKHSTFAFWTFEIASSKTFHRYCSMSGLRFTERMAKFISSKINQMDSRVETAISEVKVFRDNLGVGERTTTSRVGSLQRSSSWRCMQHSRKFRQRQSESKVYVGARRHVSSELARSQTLAEFRLLSDGCMA